jgi:hypothetical protein
MKTRWTKGRIAIVSTIAIIGAVTIAVAPALFWQLHEARQSFGKFSSAIIAKNYRAAYALTSPELQHTTDYTAFVKPHDELNSRFGDLERIDAGNYEVKERSNGWYGTMEADMVFEHTALPFTFTLKKENNRWQIYSYHQD